MVKILNYKPIQGYKEELMEVEIHHITHPNWTKLYLQVNNETIQIDEELQKRYPYFSLNYIKKILNKFLIENKELSRYVEYPVIDIAFICDKSEVNTLVDKIMDNFKRMLRYLDEKHQLVTQILEDEGESL